MWALTRQNLSSGFLTKRDSNQPPQLQRLARKFDEISPVASLDMIHQGSLSGKSQGKMKKVQGQGKDGEFGVQSGKFEI